MDHLLLTGPEVLITEGNVQGAAVPLERDDGIKNWRIHLRCLIQWLQELINMDIEI